MNVLRLGQEVDYVALVERGPQRGCPVERRGVIRALDHYVWIGKEGAPRHRCDPVPFAWVGRRLEEVFGGRA